MKENWSVHFVEVSFVRIIAGNFWMRMNPYTYMCLSVHPSACLSELAFVETTLMQPTTFVVLFFPNVHVQNVNYGYTGSVSHK